MSDAPFPDVRAHLGRRRPEPALEDCEPLLGTYVSARVRADGTAAVRLERLPGPWLFPNEIQTIIDDLIRVKTLQEGLCRRRA